MDKGVIERLPSTFIDPFRKMLEDKIQQEGKIYSTNSDKFIDALDEASRGRALEARGRQLAYSDILNKLNG